MKSTRLAFVLVSLLTIILLLGSVVLQRLVFKAAESDSSVFLAPTTFAVAPEGSITVTIHSSFSIPAYVAAGQFVIEYDQADLGFVEALPLAGFATKKVTVEDGLISWAVVPDAAHGLVGRYSGDVPVGRLTFTAKQVGVAEIKLNPARTIISAIDPEGSSALYNSVVSVQNSAGQISSSAPQSNPVVADEQLSEGELGGFTSQKITSEEIVAFPDSAWSLVALRYRGHVRVDFGSSELSLNQRAQTTTASSEAALKLQGLAANQRYYYRVRVLDEQRRVLFSHPLQSFITPVLGSALADPAQSRLVALPALAVDKAELFGSVADSAGGSLPLPVVFSLLEGSAAIEAQQDGRSVVTALGSAKQKVVVEAATGSVVLGQLSVIFDPSIQRETPADELLSTPVSIPQSVSTTLLALLGVILLSGLAMGRWLRVKQ